jgi:hypothetical protein
MNLDMAQRPESIQVQSMDRDQDQFGWMMLTAKDQKDGYPAAYLKGGELTTVDTAKMPVLLAQKIV